MKLKTSKGIYDIESVNYDKGKLNIRFLNMTCEELQVIFSDKDSLIKLEVYTDDLDLTSVIPGYVLLEQIVLRDDVKTVILTKETDDFQKRITELAEKVVGTAKETMINTSTIEQLSADVDYISMNMEVALNV